MSALVAHHTHVIGLLTGLSCHTQWLADAQGYTRHLGRLTWSEKGARTCGQEARFCQPRVTSKPGRLAQYFAGSKDHVAKRHSGVSNNKSTASEV